ncbi:MAG: hypothetical protein JW940_26310 [Polyangiaceae bacterium]|nr:hypothetical protein [Polyangiaceae bacterium]
MNTLRAIPVPEATEPSTEPAPAPNPVPAPGVPDHAAPGVPRRPDRSRWVVYVAIAIGAMVTVLLLGATVMLGAGAMGFKKTEAYQASLAFLKNDSRVVAALGEPIKSGALAQGTIRRTGGFGKAELVFNLTGSRASGSAQVMSHRDGARWIVDSATFVVDGRTETLTP